MSARILDAANRRHTFPFFTHGNSFDFVTDHWNDEQKVVLENHKQESTLWPEVHLRNPKLVIIGIDPAILSSGIIRRLATISNRPTIVAVVETSEESLLTECYAQGSDRVVAVPDCSARIFQALIETLIRKESHYPPVRINSKIQTIDIGDSEVRLAKKTFDVAQYLFINHGKLVSKSRILQDLWDLDSTQCLTRRVDVHISRVRKLLALDGSCGWEIRTHSNDGCGIFYKYDTY